MTQEFTRYVSGLTVDKDFSQAVLVRKNRPSFLEGRLCPPGGHVENGESYDEAVAREDGEETGNQTAPEDWTLYAICRGPGWEMYCYYRIADILTAIPDLTDEVVGIYSIASVMLAAATPVGQGKGPEGCSDETHVAPDLVVLLGLVRQARTRRSLAIIEY